MGWRWLAAGPLGLLLGAGLPLLASSARDVASAAIALLVLLLGGGVWAAALLVGGPRAATLVALAATVFLNLARLPAPRSAEAPYVAAQALWRTDQTLDASLTSPGAATTGGPVLRALVDARFTGAQPRFRLEAALDHGRPVRWECSWARGRQWLLLPLPAGVPQAGAPLAVRLRLAGEPTREADYLAFYQARLHADPVLALVSEADTPPPGPVPTTRCQPGAA